MTDKNRGIKEQEDTELKQPEPDNRDRSERADRGLGADYEVSYESGEAQAAPKDQKP